MTNNNAKDFWESKFSSKEPVWHFHPSDSAIEALKIFKANNIHKILIPGIGYGLLIIPPERWH